MIVYEPTRHIPKVYHAWLRGEDTWGVAVYEEDNLAADLVNIRDADLSLWTLLLAICGEDLRPAVRRAVEVIIEGPDLPRDDPFPENPFPAPWTPKRGDRRGLIALGGVVEEPHKPLPRPPLAPPSEDALWRIARDVLRGGLDYHLERTLWGPRDVRYGLRVFVNERNPGLGTGSSFRP